MLPAKAVPTRVPLATERPRSSLGPEPSRVPTTIRSATPEYCVKRPPGAPTIGLPWGRAGQTGWPFDVSTACTSPTSSPANRIDLPGRTADVAPNGTTGEREWATPVSAYGTHPEGQKPPVAPPRVTACTVRSFDMTRMPFPP